MHKFFVWFGPAVLGSTAACVGLVAALAPTYPGVKAWGQRQFDHWWHLMSAPWFLVAVATVLALYIAAILWTGRSAKPDISKLNPERGPDQLYLTKSPVGDDIANKSYLVSWSPKEYFWIYISDYESQSKTWPPSEPSETSPTFHLLNAGPNEVRHVKIKWDLGDQNIPRRVVETCLFEGYIEALNSRLITLVHDGVGAIERPIGEQAEVVIPIIKAGASVTITPPNAVTMAWAIYALSEAKRIASRPPQTENLSSIRNAMLAMKRDTVPMEPVGVSIEYVCGDSDARTQEFILTGQIRGRVATTQRSPSSDGAFHPEPGGLTACIENLEVHGK